MSQFPKIMSREDFEQIVLQIQNCVEYNTLEYRNILQNCIIELYLTKYNLVKMERELLMKNCFLIKFSNGIKINL